MTFHAVRGEYYYGGTSYLKTHSSKIISHRTAKVFEEFVLEMSRTRLNGLPKMRTESNSVTQYGTAALI